MSWIDGFHSIATLAFVAGSALVACRLLALAARTRQAPELLLGAAIGGTAVLGYGVLIAALVVRGMEPLAPRDVPPAAVVLTGLGRVLHAGGVTAFLLFVLRVFRPDAAWAKALAGTLALSLWAGLLVGALGGSFRVDNTGTPAWWFEYAVVWTYPVWSSLESFRYWRLMRRREALGLADPLVTNRFLLWGTGSAFTALAIWTASIPFAYASDPAMLATVTPPVRIATALTGLASVSCSLVAFLPPAWYRRRLAAHAASAT